MPVNTTISSLSQTASLNGPDGTDLPSVIDDALRYHGQFIAQLRDGVGFTAASLPYSALAYTPIQQGGGTSQLTNPIKIGWSGASKMRVQVDATDYGTVWPIDISGVAATATLAANSSQLGGVGIAGFVRSGSPSNTISYVWDIPNGQLLGYVDSTPLPTYTTWAKVVGRPTDLASFSNGPGYQTAANVAASSVARGGAVISMYNTGTSSLNVDLGSGNVVGWAVVLSDARLKQNIRPTVQDSLSKVRALRFKAFNFEPGHDDGHEHKTGLVAQDLEQVDAELVDSSGTWKQPRVWEMLCLALHAIQQLEARVAELEAR